MVDRIATVLRERLNDDEFADLCDILGDTDTDEWLSKRLAELAPQLLDPDSGGSKPPT